MSHRSWARAPQGVQLLPPQAQAGSAPLLPSSGPGRLCQRGGFKPLWLGRQSYEPQVVGPRPTGSTVCSSAEPGCLCATAPKLWASKHRQRGGIEPLCITAPRELKSRPGTSLSHPGIAYPPLHIIYMTLYQLRIVAKLIC